jgi:hypothetical protein
LTRPLTIASVVVVFPECLLPTTAITGIDGNDVIVCSTFPFGFCIDCLGSGISVFSAVWFLAVCG